MCLAIPAKIAQLDGDGMATVDILGVTRSVSIDLTPQAGVAISCSCTPASPSRWSIPITRRRPSTSCKEFPDLAGDELPAATA